MPEEILKIKNKLFVAVVSLFLSALRKRESRRNERLQEKCTADRIDDFELTLVYGLEEKEIFAYTYDLYHLHITSVYGLLRLKPTKKVHIYKNHRKPT